MLLQVMVGLFSLVVDGRRFGCVDRRCFSGSVVAVESGRVWQGAVLVLFVLVCWVDLLFLPAILRVELQQPHDTRLHSCRRAQPRC